MKGKKIIRTRCNFLIGIDASKFPMIKQDPDSCVVANVEAIIKFFEPSSTWTQQKFRTELCKRGEEPSFDHVKCILQNDKELCDKYKFKVEFAEAKDLPAAIRDWLKKGLPVVFSYPTAKVHVNTALSEDKGTFYIFEPEYKLPNGDWEPRKIEWTEADLVKKAKNKRDIFIMIPKTAP